MKSVFAIFQKGLRKTATAISRSVTGLFSELSTWNETTYEKLEAALIGADFGVETSQRIVRDIRERYALGQIKTGEDIVKIAQADISAVFRANARPINLLDNQLSVILLIGVNGSGKTTSAGKLAYLWNQAGKKVMLGACDTYRAAAVEQLKLWGEKTGCQVVSSRQGADPAAVAYDAVASALARKADILLIDTAGRQHTRKGLMDELAKMRRTIDKVYPGAPQEVWLTIDASSGGNVLSQTREFKQIAKVSGLILTKLDGTGKGGMAVAVQQEFQVPVFFAGFGEQPEHLQPFAPDFFAAAIFAK